MRLPPRVGRELRPAPVGFSSATCFFVWLLKNWRWASPFSWKATRRALSEWMPEREPPKEDLLRTRELERPFSMS